MPFRESFTCLWCGRAHRVRTADDVEGWAQLCPDCVGRAGDNGFLRFRLKAALAERNRAPKPRNAADTAENANAAVTAETAPASIIARPAAVGGASPAAVARAIPDVGVRAVPLDAEMLAYYEARAPEYDDWYLRRGRYSHGAIADMIWQLDLDAATQWLDSLPLRGEIVELAAGTGWWSPLLAQKGELSAYDGNPAPLDRARDRLLAHGLRAHLHVRDAWAEPDRAVDAVFTGFWLSHVPRARLPEFLGLVRRWLKPGGSFVFIDSRADPDSGASDHDREDIAPDTQLRRVADGRQFRVVKVHYDPAELEAALRTAGFASTDLGRTSRFFLYGRAVAG